MSFFQHGKIDINHDGRCTTFESGRFEAYDDTDFSEQQTMECESKEIDL